MEKRRVVKLNTIIAIILVILIIAVIIFLIVSKKVGILMTNSEIKKIANSYQHKISDEQLQRVYNDLLGEGTLIVSKESANTLKEAERLSIEYKNKVNEGISNELNKNDYKSYTDFEYIDFIEANYYYKFIGEYSYQYLRGSKLNDYSEQYTFLVFKSDYFENLYLKKNINKDDIKEFGDILAVINYGNKKIIKSEVEDKGENFIYNLYSISKAAVGPESSETGLVPAYITGYNYCLSKFTFTVNKTTGKTDLYIKPASYQSYLDYKNSYSPHMDYENIKSFREKK